MVTKFPGMQTINIYSNIKKNNSMSETKGSSLMSQESTVGPSSKAVQLTSHPSSTFP